MNNEEVNREFYDALWRSTTLITPERFNTWAVVAPLAERSAARLEIGAGMRPRFPLEGTVFIDGSQPAVRSLRGAAALATVGEIARLPFRDASFSLVGAFDIIEHVEDDVSVFREIGRVLAPDGTLLCSVPLHAAAWSGFDEVVGHCRRYDPDAFAARLGEQGLVVVESAVYGMQPKKGWLLDFGTWWLKRNREKALSWYNWFLPFSLRRQKPLQFVPGLVRDPEVDEIIAVCRRG